MKVLFLSKSYDRHCEEAKNYTVSHFEDVCVCQGEWGDTKPDALLTWEGDLIVSYLSRWVVPSSVLSRAHVAAVNFHPASPRYPGVGCVNFALYEGCEEYGVTCHHMRSRVDTGDIIAVRKFPVLSGDNVDRLLERTHDALHILFKDVMEEFLLTGAFPASDEKWGREPTTRKQLDELSYIDADMPKDEVDKRIRATSYGKFRPYTIIHGHRFILTEEK